MNDQPTAPPSDMPTAPPSDYQAPVSGVGDKIQSPSTAEGIQGSIFGAGQPNEPDTIQSIGNAVLPIAASIPAETALTGGMGTIATKIPRLSQYPRVAGALGRIAASAGIGAAKSGDIEG